MIKIKNHFTVLDDDDNEMKTMIMINNLVTVLNDDDNEMMTMR